MVRAAVVLCAIFAIAALAAAGPFVGLSLAAEPGTVCSGGTLSLTLRMSNRINTAGLFTVDVRIVLPASSVRLNEVVNVGTGESYVHPVTLRIPSAPPGTYPVTVTVSTDVARSPEVVQRTITVVDCSRPAQAQEAPPSPPVETAGPSVSATSLVVLVALLVGGFAIRLCRTPPPASPPGRFGPQGPGYYQGYRPY